MDAQDISRYRSWLFANPSAFVEGVQGFCKQAQEYAALVDTLALKGKPRIIMDADGTLQIVGNRRPKAENAMIVSETEALKMVRERLLANRMNKQAQAPMPYPYQARMRQQTDDDEEDDGRSLWDKMKPWVIGLGAGYLGLKGGEWWGRYAQSRGYRQGPIAGPFVALGNGLIPRNLKVQGTYTSQERSNAQR